MKITSAEFVGGFKGESEILKNDIPQIAVIGRSNAGKSSLINSVTSSKGLARTSNTPGRTQEINVFLINKKFHLVDLPGYGYAKTNLKNREKLQKLIFWYLFESGYPAKIFLIIDANVGPTKNDLEIFNLFQQNESNLIVIANKIDKIKKSEYSKKIKKIEDYFNGYQVIPYSSPKKKGIDELRKEMF